MFELLNR
jgi:hypothetical protein